MNETIISGLLGLFGSGIGALCGIIVQSKLTNWRLKQIENKLKELDENTKNIVDINGRIRELEHDIRDLKERIGRNV